LQKDLPNVLTSVINSVLKNPYNFSYPFFTAFKVGEGQLNQQEYNMAVGNTTSLGLLALAGVKPYELKKNEEYMNDAQKEHFTKILKAWHSQIMDEAVRTKNQMQEDVTNFADPADRATQEEEFSLELRNRDRERKLLKKIEQTLHKISDDDYGYCETCGVEIGLKRLEARPTADLCIDCKTLAEIREKQLGL
jgi:hypothetical protein